MSTNGVVAAGREAVTPSIPPAPSPAVVPSPAAEAVAQGVAASGVTNDAVRVSLSTRAQESGAPAAEEAAEQKEGVDAAQAVEALDERLTESAQKTVVRFGSSGSGEANSAELSFQVVNPSTGETVRQYPNPDAASTEAPRGAVVNDVA